MKRKKGLLALALCTVMMLTVFGGVAFAEGLEAGSTPEPTLGASLEPSPSEDTLEGASPSASVEPSASAEPSPSTGTDPLPSASLEPSPSVEGLQPRALFGARNGGVNTQEDFLAALNAGAEIIDLSDNITLSSTARITNPVQINLNGFTLGTSGRSKVLAIGANVTVQGPGTISCGDGTSSGPTSSNVVIQVSGGTLTLNNATVEAGATTGSSSTSEASGGIWVSNGNLTLNGARIVGGAYTGPGGEGGYGIWIQGSASRLEAVNSTILGGNGTDTSTSDFGSNMARGGPAVYAQYGDKVVLNGCTVTGGQIVSKNRQNANGMGGAAVWIQHDVDLEVNGGTLEGGSTVNAGTGGTGLWLQNGGGTAIIKNASVSGGEGANMGEGGTGIQCQQGAVDLTVESTSVKGGNGSSNYAGTALSTGGRNTTGTIEVTGSELSAGNGPAWSTYGIDMQSNASSVQISVTVDDTVISGGENGSAVGISASTLDGGKLKLTNSQTQGTVKVGSQGATVEQLKKLAGSTEGGVFTDENGNAQFGGKPTAGTEDLRAVYNETLDKYYGTLQDALAEASAGHTIKLQQNLDLSDAGVLDVSGLTIDLNGNTIFAENFTLIFQGSDFILRNGTFDSKGGNYALFIGDNGVTNNVVVEAVTMLGGVNVFNATNVKLRNVDITGTSYYAVWCDENGQVTIESGTFKTNGVAVLGMTNPTTDSVLNIEDGTFITSNGKPLVLESGDEWGDPVIRGGTFTADVSDYLAPGYELIPGPNGTYGVQKHIHSWAETWSGDETHHWHECSDPACSIADSEKDGYGLHTEDGGTVIVEPTETDKGLRSYACTLCKRVLRTEEIAALGHVHSYGGWQFDENNHWKVCSCGETAERSVHTYGAWRTTKAATSSEMGSRERSCTQCGYKQVVTIPLQTEVPSTGHSGNALLWAALTLLAGGGFAGAILFGRRAKSRK